MRTRRFQTFGHGLKHHREMQELTQSDLGAVIGYSAEEIHALEQGSLAPNLQDLFASFFPALDIVRASDDGLEMEVLAEQAIKAHQYAWQQPVPGKLGDWSTGILIPSHCIFLCMRNHGTGPMAPLSQDACPLQPRSANRIHVLREKLPGRLFEALMLKAQGLTKAQIAKEMCLTEDTVTRYFGRIRKMLEVPTTDAAAELFNLSMERRNNFASFTTVSSLSTHDASGQQSES